MIRRASPYVRQRADGATASPYSRHSRSRRTRAVASIGHRIAPSCSVLTGAFHRLPRRVSVPSNQTRPRSQSLARGVAEQRPAPNAGRVRNGRARVCRRALHTGESLSRRLFPHHELHLADHAGRRFCVPRSRPDWKRRHVRDSAGARRGRLAGARSGAGRGICVTNGRRDLSAASSDAARRCNARSTAMSSSI